jgi:acyl-CoA hydrolase
VIATTVSVPDKEGFVTFGTHCGAVYNPFVAACRDPERIAIAEINPQMPVVYGDPRLGDNKIALKDIDFVFEADTTAIEMVSAQATEVEKCIAKNVLDLIPNAATLQFGIGVVPDLIACHLAEGPLGDFGIHSELVADGFLKLWQAGKISNKQKGVYAGQSVFTFAFGSRALYDFLDERNGRNKRQAICLPVSTANDPHVIAKNDNFVSINSGLMIDLAGQVCSEAIGAKQYSGVGGQLSFVEGAYYAKNGRSIICLKSTATVNGNLVSNIVASLPPGSLVSTPRHFTHYIVTEYGVADLWGVSDEKRPEKLIAVAHPDFREKIREDYRTLG